MTPGRDEVPFSDSVYLQQLRVGPLKRRLDKSVIGSYTAGRAKFDVVEQTAGGMALELCSAVLGAQVLSDIQTFSIEYPKTWWQHLKQEHAPAWFTRRWPVTLIKRAGQVSFSRYDTYPLANVPLPPDEFGYPVRVEMFRMLDDARDIREEPPGPPRFRYADRIALASALFREAFPRLMAATRPDSDGPHPRIAIEIFLDTLQRFGVNVSQLADEAALASPRPEKESSC